MTPRVQTDPRIRRRRRAVQRGQRRRSMMVGAVLALLGVAAWVAFLSPLLRVRHVKLVGARHTTEEQVIAAADLSEADNLLLLSADAVERHTETLPWVKSAAVDRMLPDTIRVRVVERDPTVILGLGAARWTIDATGHVLATGEAVEGLPVLSGVEVGEVRAGIQLELVEVRAGLRAFRALPGDVKRRVVAFFAPTPERISFSLADGLVIRYGAAERLRAKRRVLVAILARLRRTGRDAAYIDVRVPTTPAVAPAAPVVAPVAVASPTSTANEGPSPSPTASPRGGNG